MNRRTMLQVTGAAALGINLPKADALETRKAVAYIVTADSYRPFELNGRMVITRSFHVFWANHPELEKRLAKNNYRYNRNVKTEVFYDVEDFPPPALKPLKLKCPNEKPLTEYKEYHCFRTYDINAAGTIKVIYDKDGSVW